MRAVSVPLAIWDPAPYHNFRYRLRAEEGRYLGGFSICRGLQTEATVISYQRGADTSPSRQLPQLMAPAPVTFELGLTRDPDFAKWVELASQTWRSDRRWNLIVQICNEIGVAGLTYVLHRAWVMSFQGIHDLDANAAGVTITTLTLGNEGRERK